MTVWLQRFVIHCKSRIFKAFTIFETWSLHEEVVYKWGLITGENLGQRRPYKGVRYGG